MNCRFPVFVSNVFCLTQARQMLDFRCWRLEKVAPLHGAETGCFPQNGFSVSGSLSIISNRQPGVFREASSNGGTAADKTAGFV